MQGLGALLGAALVVLVLMLVTGPLGRTGVALAAVPISGLGPGLTRTGVRPSRPPGGLSWADSFIAIDNECWPASSWDHGIGEVVVDTPAGRMTLRAAARRIGSPPAPRADLRFNTVACGNPPANTAGDEAPDQCPGLVTRGLTGCDIIAVRGEWWKRVR